MVNCLSAHVAGSVRHSCSLHDRTFNKSRRCFAPFRQSQKQTGCYHNPHNSRPRRSTQQQKAHCSSGADPAAHTVSRRALGLCAALLAVQWGQANAAAQASPVPSYSLAASSQQQTNQVLPEATTVLQPGSTASKFKPGQKQVLAINKRVQTQNNAPLGFPNFVRDGYEIIILADGYQESQDGLIWKDFEEGKGALPEDGQQVTFDYTAYNESGSRIDSTYTKGRPAQTRLGINGLIPGFEKGIRSMKVGGKRRLVVSPALGPPVGPSTFFSAKQCEVFDVELLDIKSCRRRQVAMFSDVVCE